MYVRRCHAGVQLLDQRRAVRPANHGGQPWGMLRLKTIGRRTSRKRVAIVYSVEDGPNLVIPAMNGWADPEPAWWLNFQSNPHATVVLPGEARREVVARAAIGKQRERMWGRLVALGSSAYTEANAAKRRTQTAIIVFEPLSSEHRAAGERSIE